MSFTLKEIQEKYYKMSDIIGSGYFARVKKTGDPTRVLKISLYDSGYRDFIGYIEELNSQHLPKIYLVHMDDDCCYVVLERLHSLVSWQKNMWERIVDKLEDTCNYHYGDQLFYKDVADDIEYSIDSAYENTKHKAWTKAVFTEDMINVCLALIFLGKEENRSIDLHGGNVMSRKDGTLVITDPWA